jgi:hypothetical protein
MSDKDVLFMKRAFALALLGMGKVAPNPLVGCVIVKNGKIIKPTVQHMQRSMPLKMRLLKLQGPPYMSRWNLAPIMVKHRLAQICSLLKR